MLDYDKKFLHTDYLTHLEKKSLDALVEARPSSEDKLVANYTSLEKAFGKRFLAGNTETLKCLVAEEA